MRAAFWAVWLLAGCASQNSGGQAVRADSTTAQTVKDEGGWSAELSFGPPGATPMPRPRPASPASVLNDPDSFLNNLQFDHGPLIGVRLSGKLPVTTTTAGTTHLEESSWFKRAWKFSLGLWPILLAALPLIAGVLIWRLKPSLFGVAWGALKGLLK